MSFSYNEALLRKKKLCVHVNVCVMSLESKRKVVKVHNFLLLRIINNNNNINDLDAFHVTLYSSGAVQNSHDSPQQNCFHTQHRAIILVIHHHPSCLLNLGNSFAINANSRLTI